MWKFIRDSTLAISVTYSHDKWDQNKYNMNLHHEITRSIYDGKILLQGLLMVIWLVQTSSTHLCTYRHISSKECISTLITFYGIECRPLWVDSNISWQHLSHWLSLYESSHDHYPWSAIGYPCLYMGEPQQLRWA